MEHALFLLFSTSKDFSILKMLLHTYNSFAIYFSFILFDVVAFFSVSI